MRVLPGVTRLKYGNLLPVEAAFPLIRFLDRLKPGLAQNFVKIGEVVGGAMLPVTE